MDFFEIGSYSGGVWAKSQGQICDEDLLIIVGSEPLSYLYTYIHLTKVIGDVEN